MRVAADFDLTSLIKEVALEKGVKACVNQVCKEVSKFLWIERVTGAAVDFEFIGSEKRVHQARATLTNTLCRMEIVECEE